MKFLHILTVIVGFGGVLLNGVYGAKAKGAKPRQGLAILEANWSATKIAEIAIYLVALTGLVLSFQGGSRFDELWLPVSLGLYVVALVISLAVIQPTVRKIIAVQRRLVDGDRSAGSEMGKLGRRIQVSSTINHVFFLAILLLMVFRWGS